ncbi:C40 family peptidase [Kordiimonas sediminis]|nr:NlpC/P60 family protein [Kordiimonas sediminis]
MPDLIDPTGLVNSHPSLSSPSAATHSVCSARTPMKAEPDGSGQTINELLFGELVQVVASDGTWCKVISLTDNYTGWILADALSEPPSAPTHYIAVKSAHTYDRPHLKASPVHHLSAGALITVTDTEKRYFRIEDGSWIFSGHVRRLGDYDADPLDFAMQFLGTPYLWGSRSAAGIDCSGLVQISCAQAGIRTLRDSGMQWESLGTHLDTNDIPRKGDLAFFPGHVGYMVSETHILHANATNMAVTIDPLVDVTAWVAADTDKPSFSGFKRLHI